MTAKPVVDLCENRLRQSSRDQLLLLLLLNGDGHDDDAMCLRSAKLCRVTYTRTRHHVVLRANVHYGRPM